MKNFFYNNDDLSKAMQNAGLKKALSQLKSFEELDNFDVLIILESIRDILSCYNCVPINCLKKRIKKVINLPYSRFNGYIPSLISELEAFLNLDNKSEDDNPMYDNISPSSEII